MCVIFLKAWRTIIILRLKMHYTGIKKCALGCIWWRSFAFGGNNGFLLMRFLASVAWSSCATWLIDLCHSVRIIWWCSCVSALVSALCAVIITWHNLVSQFHSINRCHLLVNHFVSFLTGCCHLVNWCLLWCRCLSMGWCHILLLMMMISTHKRLFNKPSALPSRICQDVGGRAA